MEYTFSLLFDDRTISILAYNLETVLAEKLETVLSRNIANTRPRDYYDIHILYALRGAECDKATLRRALERTTQKRGSGSDIQIVSESMKHYAASKDKNIHKLMQYAEQLRVKPKVLCYMEVLL